MATPARRSRQAGTSVLVGWRGRCGRTAGGRGLLRLALCAGQGARLAQIRWDTPWMVVIP